MKTINKKPIDFNVTRTTNKDNFKLKETIHSFLEINENYILSNSYYNYMKFHIEYDY